MTDADIYRLASDIWGYMDNPKRSAWNDPVPDLRKILAKYVVTAQSVEQVTMAILRKQQDPAPGIDWQADRQWTVNRVRELARHALTQLTEGPTDVQVQSGVPNTHRPR